MKFCIGSPTCAVCGAEHREGVLQNCPNRRRDAHVSGAVSPSSRFCAFLERKQGTPCQHCGRVLPRDLRPGEIYRQLCDGTRLQQGDRKEPSLAMQAWNYSTAATRWKLAGSPVRSQEKIAELLAICEACPHFSTKNRPHCTLCGCTCNETQDGMRNKLAMATEKCPLDPPRWE